MKRHALATVTALALALALPAGDVSAQEPPSVAPTTPMPAAAGPAPVRVHLRTINNKGTARMYIHRADGSYTLVCAAPCTADVPGNSELRVTLGNNEEDPHTFVLPSELGSEVDLEVRPPSVGALVGSITLMGSGGVLAITGLLLVALSDAASGLSGSSSRTNAGTAASDSNRTTGFVIIGLGAAVVVAGLVWFATRSHEPRVETYIHREQGPQTYSRRDTLLGDTALARPRDPVRASELLSAPILPLHYGFTF